MSNQNQKPIRRRKESILRDDPNDEKEEKELKNGDFKLPPKEIFNDKTKAPEELKARDFKLPPKEIITDKFNLPIQSKTFLKIGNNFIKDSKLTKTKDVIEDLKNKRGLSIESKLKSNLTSSTRPKNFYTIYSLEWYVINIEENGQFNKFSEIDIVRNQRFLDLKNEMNSRLLTEYINEIIVNLKKDEDINHPKPLILKNEDNQNLFNSSRSLFVDWLVEVSNKLTEDVLFFSVNLMDRYISIKFIETEKFKFHLIASGALFIAMKFEGHDISCKEFYNEFCFAKDNSFSIDDIKQIEWEILITLNFDILRVSPLDFLKRFLHISESNSNVKNMSIFILEISLLDVKCLRYMPSLLAASSLYSARKVILKNENFWDGNLEFYTSYSVNQMEDCVASLYNILKNIPNSALCSSRRKIEKKKFIKN